MKIRIQIHVPSWQPAQCGCSGRNHQEEPEAGWHPNGGAAHLEWASFIDKVKNKDFDAVTLSWAQSLESDPYQLWHSSGASPEARGSNHCSFADPLADQLIDIIRLTLDEKKRIRAEWSLERILDSQQPYMFLFAPKDHGVYHKRFQGVKWYKLRPGFDLTEWYVPKEQQLRGKN